MTEPYGIYSGTIGEREYADGFDRGRAAGEHDARNFPETVWNTIEEMRGEASALDYRSRAYWLGWLRGYRSEVRR